MSLDLLFFAAAALGIAAIATIPAIIAHARRSRNARPLRDKYQDPDGEATPESMAAFSTKWQRLAVLAFAAIGLGCQTALSVVVKASPLGEQPFALQNWLIAASWVCFILFITAGFPLTRRRL